MKSKVVCWIAAALAALTIVTALGWAQPGGFGGPPPGGGMGGGPPGDMGDMVYLEKSWTAVSFQLDCTPEQQDSLKPTYATELQTRDEALAQAMKKRDMNAMQKALQTCKTKLNARLKEVLSDEQWPKLQQLMQPARPPR